MEAPVCIPANVRRVHIAGEKLGFWFAGPVCILASLSMRKGLLRKALFVAGVGTMVVDAWLLKQAKNG